MPHDVLRIDSRHVIRVRMLGPDGTVQIETAYSLPGEEDPCWVTGSEFRRWAAGAEVLRTGEEE